MKENALDKIINYVSPEWGRKRTENRFRSDILTRSGYQGAKKTRFNDGWISNEKSQNEEVVKSLTALRARSVDLFQNDAYARRGLLLLVDNMIGTGIHTEFDDENIQNKWSSFCEGTQSDFDGRFNYFGLQYMAIHTAFMLGDCIIRKRAVKPSAIYPYSFKVQLLPPQFLDHSYEMRMEKGKIKGGIEFDSEGRRIAYHLFRGDPLEGEGSGSERVRVLADEITIFSVDDFLNQHRGIPVLTNNMSGLKDLQEFEEAELRKQKFLSYITGFVTKPPEEYNALPDAKEDTKSVKMGTLMQLENGETITFPTPPSLDGYGEHIKQSLLKASASLGVPHCLLSQDFSGMNYSSFKGAWLAFHKQTEIIRNVFIIPRFCEIISSWFLADLKGMGARITNEKRFYSSPRRELLDPKEIPGLILEMRSGLQSPQEVLKSLGRNPQQILTDIASWNKQLDELQIVLTSDARKHENGGPHKKDEDEKQIDSINDNNKGKEEDDN